MVAPRWGVEAGEAAEAGPADVAAFVSTLVRGLRGGSVPVRAALDAASAAAPGVAAGWSVWWGGGRRADGVGGGWGEASPR